MAAVDGRVKGGALELQAEIGMKLLKATEASGAEYDSAAAEAYQKEVETRIAKLETESNQLTGKDNKKERSAKGKEIAELKNEHKYVDACKIVKGLEPKFLDCSGSSLISASIVHHVCKFASATHSAPETPAERYL